MGDDEVGDSTGGTGTNAVPSVEEESEGSSGRLAAAGLQTAGAILASWMSQNYDEKKTEKAQKWTEKMAAYEQKVQAQQLAMAQKAAGLTNMSALAQMRSYTDTISNTARSRNAAIRSMG